MNVFPELDVQKVLRPSDLIGPTYSYEYNTRDTYGKNITGWGVNDPLNATWWHMVTDGG